MGEVVPATSAAGLRRRASTPNPAARSYIPDMSTWTAGVAARDQRRPEGSARFTRRAISFRPTRLHRPAHPQVDLTRAAAPSVWTVVRTLYTTSLLPRIFEKLTSSSLFDRDCSRETKPGSPRVSPRGPVSSSVGISSSSTFRDSFASSSRPASPVLRISCYALSKDSMLLAMARASELTKSLALRHTAVPPT
jgi:hypothetical protein